MQAVAETCVFEAADYSSEQDGPCQSLPNKGKNADCVERLRIVVDYYFEFYLFVSCVRFISFKGVDELF